MMGRNSLFIMVVALLFSYGFTAQAATDDNELWQGLKQTYFGDREIRENADDLLVLEAPTRAKMQRLSLSASSLCSRRQQIDISKIFISSSTRIPCRIRPISIYPHHWGK